MDGMFGHQPLLAIVSHIIFYRVSFYALQALMPEKIIRKNRVFKRKFYLFF